MSGWGKYTPRGWRDELRGVGRGGGGTVRSVPQKTTIRFMPQKTTMRFVPQKINNKVRATKNHINRLISSH